MKLSLWHDDLAVWGAAAVTIHTDTCTHALYGVCVCVWTVLRFQEKLQICLKKKEDFFLISHVRRCSNQSVCCGPLQPPGGAVRLFTSMSSSPRSVLSLPFGDRDATFQKAPLKKHLCHR